ncbi:cation:proton antiporter [Corynebacterium gerontici]|uniref:Na(+)/H(+) antiporter ApNhaP n=1 Tax=Corynebacterium gerontici TaxID=2079234 RepID=A0A3G6J085_9CORY|nr:sodium:proton antiporter [Corynebacterium gerontici]AZA11367.1 Na(+)/H(+) antiporter ApNhaP [Corynebacterium gerontici]
MEVLIGLVALLFATVVVVAVGDRTGLPWPPLMAILAGVAMLFPRIPESQVPPQLMLPIFIPPLLWALARRTSWASIRRNWRVVVQLSVILVVITAFAVGFSAYLLVPSLTLAGAVVLGAAISPPDPVAVDAVAEPAGVPRRLTATLQTEGLFNDAASIVVFNLGLSVLLRGEEISWWEAIATFLYAAGSAVLIGLLLGRGAAWFNNRLASAVAGNAFTWVIPFATFIVAEEIHSSGVIAIVVAAIEFNSRNGAGAEDRLSGSAFWEVVELLFTGVAFGLIGLSVRTAIEEVGAQLWHAVWLGLVLSVVAVAVRAFYLYLIYLHNRKKGRRIGAPLRLQEVLLLTWGGMRGLVTLALVLSIPPTAGFGLYSQLPVIALVVLVVTMVIPGLLLPWLMRVLDLEHGPDAFGDQARARLEARARFAAGEVLERYIHDIPADQLEALRRRFEEDIHVDIDDDHHAADRQRILAEKAARMNRIRLEALYASQAELLRARRERDVDPAILDDVLYDVDSQILATEKRLSK